MNESDNEKLLQILQTLSELRNEVAHLNQRMEDKSEDIKALKKEIEDIKIKLALNDQKTDKFDYWFKIVIGGIVTILLGFIAIRLGVK